MAGIQPKKLLVLDILKVLAQETDEDHGLSQKQIAEKVEQLYGLKADRKAIRRNLTWLIEADYPIGYDTVPKTITDPETGEEVETEIQTGFYLMHDFTDAELRMLIDSVAFSKHVTPEMRKEVIGKLEGLSSRHFKSRMRHVSCPEGDGTNNAQIFLNIEVLDEAISEGKKVRFKYLTHGTDKRPYYRKRADGTDRVYTVSPYQMAAREGKYYLICNLDGHDDVANYRVDRIAEIEKTEERARPFSDLRDSNGRKLDLEKYLREHPYMYSSKVSVCQFRVPARMAPEVMEAFGDQVTFEDEGTTLKVTARVDEQAMAEYAKRFCPDVVALSPPAVVRSVKEQLTAALAAYEEDSE